MTAPTESSSRDRTPARGTIRAQRAARRPTRTSGRPALLWGGLLLGAAAVAIGLKVAVGAMTRVDTVVAVLDSGGKPFAGCDLELFAYDDSNAAPARPQRLGQLTSTRTDAIVVPDAMVPGYALARAKVAGVGVTSFLLQKGAAPARVTLAPAVAIAGAVRDANGQALAGARIEAIGGSDKGLVLAETISGSDGEFTLQGVSPSVRHVVLRAFKAGYAWRDKTEFTFTAPRAVVCTLLPTEPVEGRVVVPAGVPSRGLVVQANALPGVAAETGDGGAFRLDHLPPQTEVKLIVKGLPDGYTHRGARATAGGAAEITVTRACQVSGTVVDGRSGQIPHLAVVRHDHGPRGEEVFRLDEFGRFLLGNVPEGEVTLEAFLGVEREQDAPYAAVPLTFAAGERKQDIAITLR